MTAKERSQLVAIVKARFRLLRMQAKARAYEIYEIERKRQELEEREQSVEFSDRIAAINEKAKPLFDEIQVVVREAKAAGFAWRGSLGNETIASMGFYAEQSFRGQRYSDNVERQIVCEIDRAELAVLEELLVVSIESEDAKEYLARIPTIEGLVSGEQILAALTASSEFVI